MGKLAGALLGRAQRPMNLDDPGKRTSQGLDVSPL